MADDPFPANDAHLVGHDLTQLIVAHLRRRGLHLSARTLADEARVLPNAHKAALRKTAEAVTEGDWETLREIAKGVPSRLRKGFLFAVNKQEFLELVDRQESQLAFAVLNRRLKPLESQCSPDDFRELAYLTTCRSVRDAFREWPGVQGSREALANDLRMMLRNDMACEVDDDPDVLDVGIESDDESVDDADDYVQEDDRLVRLVQQAYRYQIDQSRARPKQTPRITSLLEDFRSVVVPDVPCGMFAGHTQSVKCIVFIGANRVASGANDARILLWDIQRAEASGASGPLARLEGHTGRVWDLAATADGSVLVSVSADSSMKTWKMDELDAITSSDVATYHEGDIYAVVMHPGSRHVITCGLDRTAKLIDIETGVVVKTLSGHSASVTGAAINPIGNLVVTGSKDATVKFYDLTSGTCIKTLSKSLGEISSIALSAHGDRLLAGSTDSCNRMFDVRTGNLLQRYKGHQNSRLNFVRASFGPGDAVIVGGSEDGRAFLWDTDSGNVLGKLAGHGGPVFSATWSDEAGRLATCSDDGTVRLWGS